MSIDKILLATAGLNVGEGAEAVEVHLSNEVVQLLSEQLYRSPLKAIEELVVNSFDANATECRVFVPSPTDQERKFIAVYDNGIGMDYDGLVNLWQIGRSNKRSEEVEKRTSRKQIGKFGIGKLATYTIANRLTYVTKKEKVTLFVTIDYRAFSSSQPDTPVRLQVRKITDDKDIKAEPSFKAICSAAAIDIDGLFQKGSDSWTIAILEELKPKASGITPSRLKWVLKTAMPLNSKFQLFLNGEPLARSVEDFDPIKKFTLADLPPSRLKSITDATGEEWEVKSGGLFSKAFNQGIYGTVIIVNHSLVGKSSDLERSNGFFIRVRDRLINQEDPYFGITQSSYETFARFRAEIQADDLDSVLTAPREGVEDSGIRGNFIKLLNEVFYMAREAWEDYKKDLKSREDPKKETERNYIESRLVEHPIADVLYSASPNGTGSEADQSWFYLDLDSKSDLKEIAETLYAKPRSKYRYQYTHAGRSSRIVRFNLASSTFTINSDHDFIRSHDDGETRSLLEDMVTAEALLEVYLREYGVSGSMIGQILEQRDALLRSMAADHPYSLKAIAGSLIDATANEHDLEVALVAAARSLGFVATHIGGSGEPDGLARVTQYPGGELKITLEAKSSAGIPTLAALDFSGLAEHKRAHCAKGCLLISPGYPGDSRTGAAANRAGSDQISCWTIDQLARVVEAAESRHFTTQHVLDIVLNRYTPFDVSEAVERLFRPTWDSYQLYREIIKALRHLEHRVADSPREFGMIAAMISLQSGFEDVSKDHIRQSLIELAPASLGLISITDSYIVVHGSLDELERRAEGLLGHSAGPRRSGTFRDSFGGDS